MNYNEVVEYLYSFIPKTNMQAFPGEYGMRRTKMLLEKLGNPQEQVKVIHVAGTSGKGSTATMIASLLVSHGKKVGLHVKPHIYDIRERFQIDNKLISTEQLTTYVNYLLPAINEVNQSRYGKLTYFEVLISLAYYIFSVQKVDYAVIETGVGGELDGSNTVMNPNKIAVITSIGFDHTALLGKTLTEIARQKAGIFHKGNYGIALFQSQTKPVFQQVAEERGCMLELVKPESLTKNVTVQHSRLIFDFSYQNLTINNIEIGLAGLFQRDNACLALLAVIHALARENKLLDGDRVRATFKKLNYPGRFDKIKVEGKTLILDGAHNVQKMKAFLESLQLLYPQNSYTFLVAFKKGKEIRKMLDLLIPLSSKIYISDFFNNQTDFVNISEDVHVIASQLERKNFSNYEIVYSASKVMRTLLKKSSEDLIVCTGSLYLLSEIYTSLRNS